MYNTIQAIIIGIRKIFSIKDYNKVKYVGVIDIIIFHQKFLVQYYQCVQDYQVYSLMFQNWLHH